jgi:uncharacterized membrane protein YeaQ/YmgE (transglycosylase-associated protein family)
VERKNRLTTKHPAGEKIECSKQSRIRDFEFWIFNISSFEIVANLGNKLGAMKILNLGGIMGIIGWIFFGLVVGAVGKLLMPGRDPGGFVVTILLGIAGALVGGFLGRALGMYREDDPVGFVMAVLGSIALLVLYRLTFARRSV